MESDVAADLDTFAEWAVARQRGLLQAANLMTGDFGRAEDLVQEAMIKVALRWERLHPNGNPDAYARRVIYRDHVSWWRRRRDMPVASTPEEIVPAADVDTVLVVQEALGSLTAKQRAVVVLRFFEDLTEADTAELLGVSVGTVKSQTAAALRRLRVRTPQLLVEAKTETSEHDE